MSAAKILWKEYRNITNPKTGLKQVHVDVQDDNIFIWNVSLIIVDPSSLYDGAYLTGQLRFPSNYPFTPPSFKFTPPIFHPNVYVDGRLCISILHTANSETGDEPVDLTWSPAQNVESVLLSIISLLEDPNTSSPANVEASICYRKSLENYKEKVQLDVERSIKRIPKDIKLPTLNDLVVKAKDDDQIDDNEDWWEEDYYDDDEYDQEEEEEEEEDNDDDDDDDDDVANHDGHREKGEDTNDNGDY